MKITTTQQTKTSTNAFMYFAIFSGNLIAYVTGSAYSWASPVIPKITVVGPDNPFSQPATTIETAWIASLLSLGASIGPFAGGFSSEKLGRKKTLLLFALPMLTAHLILAFAQTILLYYIAKFLLGIGCGCVLAVLPIYIGEISEKSNRGSMSFCMTLMLTLGTLTNYVVGPYVSIQNLCFISIIPIILFFATFAFFIPESPYYLIYTNKTHLAEKSLQKLRRKSKDGIKDEFTEMIKNVEATKLQKMTFKTLFKSKNLMKGLMISCVLMVFQQLSGYSALRSYMQPVLKDANTSLSPELAVNIVGTIQFLATICASQLVDKLGRKILLLFSTAGTCFCLIALGVYFYLKTNNFDVEPISWLPIVSLVLYVVSFTSGLGPVAWTFMGELFAANVKSLASTLTTFTCLFTAFVMTMVFPLLAEAIGMAATCWILSVFCAAGFIFCKIVVVETKGKSFQEIQDMLSLQGTKV